MDGRCGAARASPKGTPLRWRLPDHRWTGLRGGYDRSVFRWGRFRPCIHNRIGSLRGFRQVRRIALLLLPSNNYGMRNGLSCRFLTGSTELKFDHRVVCRLPSIESIDKDTAVCRRTHRGGGHGLRHGGGVSLFPAAECKHFLALAEAGEVQPAVFATPLISAKGAFQPCPACGSIRFAGPAVEIHSIALRATGIQQVFGENGARNEASAAILAT